MTKLKNIAIAIVSLLIFSNIANAQAVKASHSVNGEKPLEVKYLGEDGRYLLFQVTLQSKNFANDLFSIEDKTEGELYAETLAANVKIKNIKIEKRSGQVLDFKLFLGSETYSKSFSVNTSQVEQTTVSESDITKL